MLAAALYILHFCKRLDDIGGIQEAFITQLALFQDDLSYATRYGTGDVDTFQHVMT